MSIQSMVWALEQRVVVDAPARHVLLCLANYADKTGRGAFPSTNSLSEDTGLSVRTVKYKLDDLEALGVIRRGNQALAAVYIDRHDRRPIVYDLAHERGATAAPRSERGAAQDATGCSSEQNGVQLETERGAGAAPNPSSNRPLPVNEPKPMCMTELMNAFDRFWQAYPKKAGKKDAVKAWAKLNPDGELCNTIMTALVQHKASRDWAKDDGQYIPHASRWLNGEKWTDQLKPAAAGTGKSSAYTGLPKHTPDMYQETGNGAPF